MPIRRSKLHVQLQKEENNRSRHAHTNKYRCRIWVLDSHKSTETHYTAWSGLIAVCLKILAHPSLHLRMLGWQDNHFKTALHYAADRIHSRVYVPLNGNMISSLLASKSTNVKTPDDWRRYSKSHAAAKCENMYSLVIFTTMGPRQVYLQEKLNHFKTRPSGQSRQARTTTWNLPANDVKPQRLPKQTEV